MLVQLLKFEWYCHTRQYLFYVTLATFLGLGYVLGASNGMSFPNVNKNSPFEVSYLTGLLSMAAIFSITVSVAQNAHREADHQFGDVLFTTPVPRPSFLWSRVVVLSVVSLCALALAVVGLFLAHRFSWAPADRMGGFEAGNYIWPLLVLAIPNMILCVAVMCSTAWLTRSKLAIYLTGLLIYVFYMLGSIASNSPMMAGAAPGSPESMSLAARLDPFGMAAFFEQTRYWTAAERNTLSLSLTGNLLFNRVLWLSVSLLLLTVSGLRFSLAGHVGRSGKAHAVQAPGNRRYRAAATAVTGFRHHMATVFTFMRLDMLSVFKGIPFVLILLMMTGLLIIECTNAVSGNAGTGELYATSSLMVSTIQEVIPFFALLVILFYSSEIVWRSRDRRMDSIEDTTPADRRAIFVARLLTLAFLALILVVVSCLLGMITQLVSGVPEIEWNTYALLFYYLYGPLVVAAVVVLSIQNAIAGKYPGLLAATVIVLLCGTSLGTSAGITHPLVRFIHPVPVPLFEMNGYGAYATAFHWQMVYWLSAACLLILVSGRLGSTRSRHSFRGVFPACMVVFLLSGGYIVYQHDFRHPTPSGESVNDWKQAYEQQFKRYEGMDQPAITDVKTNIRLHPEQQRYEVQGEYELVNRSHADIDSLLIYISQESELESMRLRRPATMRAEGRYGHYWFRLKEPLRPGDTTRMTFSFRSGWSPFRGHTAFNSIIGNGTFIRISNYYPSLGYESGNEITNSIERQKRSMPSQTPLKKLEEPQKDPYDYQFIRFSAVVSTDKDQTVIGPGNLVRRWTEGDRNYFHYRSGGPIPFRFAFSSAKYRTRTAAYKDIPIEVYYDPRHSVNVGQLIRDAKRTLEYCETNFGKYPQQVVRFAEISAFAEGFAATAYPGAIFMKENGGFHNNVSRGDQHDVINALAGHELSHQWWGTARLDPEYKEGGWLLTETLAKYTELMLYEKQHGKEAVRDLIRYHLDTYLSVRSYSRETSLVKTTFETPHLPYNKGFMVMYQLKELIGEKSVNRALKSLLAKHAFPKPPADAEDLLQEFYGVAPQKVHPVINELFRKIILWDGRIGRAEYRTVVGGHEVTFEGTMRKYQEDGRGNRHQLTYSGPVQLGVYDDRGKLHVRSFPVRQGQVSGTILLREKPDRIVMDPSFKRIDAFPADNERP